jgi:hypothetical protein
MKKFIVPCQFGDTKAPFNIYIGEPVDDGHPLEQQAAWLARERGGEIPAEVMDSFAKLHEIAKENGVSFEELCVRAGNGNGHRVRKHPHWHYAIACVITNSNTLSNSTPASRAPTAARFSEAIRLSPMATSSTSPAYRTCASATHWSFIEHSIEC